MCQEQLQVTKIFIELSVLVSMHPNWKRFRSVLKGTDKL